MIIELEKIGLLNPTRVKCNGRVLETQGLSVEQLVDLWRNYYDIPSYTIIYLRPTNDKLFNSLYFTSKYNKKPLAELFREQYVYVIRKRKRKLKADIVEKDGE